jgi:hypothetical protein
VNGSLFFGRQRLAWLLLAVIVTFACSGSGHTFRERESAGGATQKAGNGGIAARGGNNTGEGGNFGGSGGPLLPEGGQPDPVSTPSCKPGTRRCSGDTREECDANSNWIRLPEAEQCGPATPACTGDGLCSAYRLVGAVETLLAASPPRSPRSSDYVLLQQTFLDGFKQCSSDYCVSGGIRP